MRKQMILIGVLAVASCVSGPPHHRGGAGGGNGGSLPNYATAAHTLRTAGTADADAILFAGFDRDGDLLVSAAELEDGVAREFAWADANHDGGIDPAEYRAWSLRALGGVYAPFRQDVDRDGDGKVTMAEFASELRARAHRYDSNGDGVIEHGDLVHTPANSVDDVQLLTPERGGMRPDMEGDGPPRRR